MKITFFDLISSADSVLEAGRFSVLASLKRGETVDVKKLKEANFLKTESRPYSWRWLPRRLHRGNTEKLEAHPIGPEIGGRRKAKAFSLYRVHPGVLSSFQK
jgi:hypothetical protein